MVSDFPSQDDVSRETLDRLGRYNSLLARWSQRINLISRSTLADSWNRHIVDSIQVAKLAPEKAERWVDLGAGAGFPGLVVAILRPDIQVTLIESDQRKSAFLRAACRETGTAAKVLSERIEDVPPLNSDVISARALAPLTQLLAHAERHLSKDGTAIFPKGRQYRQEWDNALEKWRFHCDTYPSQTEEGAVLLKLTEIVRV